MVALLDEYRSMSYLTTYTNTLAVNVSGYNQVQTSSVLPFDASPVITRILACDLWLGGTAKRMKASHFVPSSQVKGRLAADLHTNQVWPLTGSLLLSNGPSHSGSEMCWSDSSL